MYDENIYAKIINGELNEDEIAKLKSTGEWQEIQAILDASNEFSLSPHNKEEGYQALLRKRDNNKPVGGRRIFMQVMAVAAVALLAIGFFFFIKGNQITTSAQNGQLAKVALSDNTVVVLNDGSSIEYEKNISEKQRMVNLKGEALFKVVPGNKFIVQTTNGSVEVLGTQFNVRAWGSNLSVQCYSGKVAVTSNNERIELNTKEGVVVMNGQMNDKTIVENETAEWLEGTSRIRQEPLNEVFEEIERQYDITIKYPNDDRLFAGAFSHDNLQNALREVCDPMGLQFKIVKPDLVEVYK